MACTAGCPTQSHQSYAQCLRAKTIKVAYCNTANGWDATTQKNWDAELTAYDDARRAGIQPAGTNRAAVDEAVRISDDFGAAYNAETQSFNK